MKRYSCKKFLDCVLLYVSIFKNIKLFETLLIKKICRRLSLHNINNTFSNINNDFFLQSLFFF